MTAFDPTPLRPDAPANPVHGGWYETDDPRNRVLGGGLTARQHAAIALCVPDSGTPWLDAMINRRRRDEFAKAALQGMLADLPESMYGMDWMDTVTKESFKAADAMLAASNKEPE